MPNKMLIDASHPEETRVVVLRGNRVEEFDFESADKKQLRGNIYLAKVTRVEPSLQAAFVDYGGNRHGFLAFPEIHPDYYQIPVMDRQALIEDEARAQRDEDEDEQRSQRRSRRFRHGDRTQQRRADRRRSDEQSRGDAVVGEVPEASPEQAAAGSGRDGDLEPTSRDLDAPAAVEAMAEADADVESFGAGVPADVGEPAGEAVAHLESVVDDGDEDTLEARAGAPAIEPSSPEWPDLGEGDEAVAPAASRSLRSETGEPAEAWPEESRPEAASEDETDEVVQLGGDAMEEVPAHRHRYRKQYKIQEVIKRRQILLVQVVKEERGNKGAALTTYLSLAGRYSVLMPNTARGGGISRKITDATDRQRLKSIVQDLEVPEGMGVILRTAGAARTKAEVKRDFEYLLRMWETVRETTLRSTAPTLVYEEGSLIKRAIRDLYNKDIDEVVVAGDDGYREAKEFMRLLMPSHAKNVQPYRDPQPLFAKQGVETQLDAMFSSQVTLKSGGYIVINQTEALVAIDVNSGRSTREHNIEDTALRTNLEAVDEIARQLRLRDLAGLIVLDLIDMEESRNNRAVERRLKDALKNDRARIQVGTISHFGLLEMSRQRIRSGVLEASTIVCPHCAGSGTLRSTASIALHILRVLEDALIKNASYDITVKARTHVALYILNQKRGHLRNLEARFGVAITIEVDESLTGPTYYALERGELASGIAEPAPVVPGPIMLGGNGAAEPMRDDFLQDTEIEAGADEAEELVGSETGREPEAESEAEGRGRRRRRRRRGRGGDREVSGIAANAPQPPDDALGAIARFGGLEAQAATAPRGEPEPELELPLLVTEPEAAAAAPEIADTGERRRSRRSARSRHEIAGAPVPEARPDGEATADAEAEPAVAGPEPEAGEAPRRPTRARRGRRTTKARMAEEQLGAAEDTSLAVAGPAGSEALDGTRETTPAPQEVVVAAAPEAQPEPVAPEGDDSSSKGATRSELPDAAAAATPSEESRVPPPAAPEPPVSHSGAEERPKRSGWWQRAKASQRS